MVKIGSTVLRVKQRQQVNVEFIRRQLTGLRVEVVLVSVCLQSPLPGRSDSMVLNNVSKFRVCNVQDEIDPGKVPSFGRVLGREKGARKGDIARTFGRCFAPNSSSDVPFTLSLYPLRPVARLQSRSPLHQAQEYSLRAGRFKDTSGFERNDGFVALKTGPGDRNRNRVASNHRGSEGSSRYEASTDRQWAKADSGASVDNQADTDRRSSPASPGANLRPSNEAAS